MHDFLASRREPSDTAFPTLLGVLFTIGRVLVFVDTSLRVSDLHDDDVARLISRLLRMLLESLLERFAQARFIDRHGSLIFIRVKFGCGCVGLIIIAVIR